MKKKEIRWQQRFNNFEKTVKLLERTLEIKKPSEAEKGGLVQFYEMAFELSWKTLKDYSEAEGFNVKSPRETIKTAFQAEFISNGHLWLEALEDRNLTAHIYDEATSDKVIKKIRTNYFHIIKELYLNLKNELDA